MASQAREALKMLMAIKDTRLRAKRAKNLPPIPIKVANLSPTAYCALMQMKGAMPSATPEQLAEAQRVFGSVIDRATQLAAVTKGLRELDDMGIGIFVPCADGSHSFYCYPNLDLLTEVVAASSLQ